MSQWTEAEIRAYLDGTWTILTYEGRIVTVPVNEAFKPSRATEGRKVGIDIPQQAIWTEAEDETLISMRNASRTFADIAWEIGRTEASVKKHFRILRAKGLVT